MVDGMAYIIRIQPQTVGFTPGARFGSSLQTDTWIGKGDVHYY